MQNEYEENSKLLQIEKDKIWENWNLQKDYEEEIKKIQNEKQDIINNTIKEYKNRIIDKLNNTDVERIIKKSLGTTIELKDVSSFSNKGNGELCRFKKAEIINGNKSNENININVVDTKGNKYGLNKLQYENLLNEFIEKFHTKNRLIFLMDKSNKIIGFEIDNNHKPKLSWHCSGSDIFKSITEMGNIKLAKRFDDGNYVYMMEGSYITYFKSESVLEHIIINLLNQLNEKYGCWITIKKDSNENLAFVSEFWFKITDEDYLKNTIMNIIEV